MTKNYSYEEKRGEGIVVSRSAINQARQRAAYFYKILNKIPRIGFREPDQLNLERALVIASASLGKEGRGFLSLPNAIKFMKKNGDGQDA